MSRLPCFSRQLAHRWQWVCQLHAPAGRPLPLGRFLVLISVRGWVDPRAGKIRSTEKSNDLTGNRTCDLLACSIEPQPTILPCGILFLTKINVSLSSESCKQNEVKTILLRNNKFKFNIFSVEQYLKKSSHLIFGLIQLFKHSLDIHYCHLLDAELWQGKCYSPKMKSGKVVGWLN
jgi:hypothetical protein